MEDAKDFKEDDPPESSLGPILLSPDKDQSPNASPTTQDTNGEVESNTRGPMMDFFQPAPLYDAFDSSYDSPKLLTENLFATSHVTAEGIGSEHNFGMPVVVSQEATVTKSENEVPLEFYDNKNSTILSESISRTLERNSHDASPKSLDSAIDRPNVQENDASNGPRVENEVPLEFHDDKNSTILSESISSTLETNSHDASPKSLDSALDRPNVQENDASNGPRVEHEAPIALAKDQNTVKPQKEENLEAKIVVQPSPEDDNINSPQARNGQIDTAAPFESVKAAVSKFGGILDWKAHRVRTKERRKFIELELETAKEEIPLYKKQAEDAEVAKIQVLKELNSTKRLVEELKLNLERAQTEEHQAQQDSELAKLRVEEMEQGIADDASIAARAQLEVARARNAAAVAELKTVKDELEQLRKDYTLLMTEKDAAVKKAEKTVFTAKEVMKSVEDMTIELISTKESLESAHAAHLEAEEHRVGAVMAKEQDTLNWEKELKEAGEELEKLNQRISLAKDMKSKLDTASALLKDLKAELAAYMESNSKQETVEEANLRDALEEPETKTHGYIKAAVASAGKELENTKLNIQKAKTKSDCLKVESASLKSELEKEKSEFVTFQQREGMASIAIASLENGLNRIKSEVVVVQKKEKEEREKKMELLKKLQEAAKDAEGAKALAQIAQEHLQEAKEEAEEAQAGASTMESRLRVAQKEIESAKASEKVALAAINALQESESATNYEDSPAGLTLSLEEYYDLNKRVHEAEELANMKVAVAISQVEEAKESELRSLSKLQEVNRVMAERKDTLEVALHKAEKAKEEKLGVEQELRKWRADHEQKRRLEEFVPGGVNPNGTPRTSFEEKQEPENLVSKTNVQHGESPNPHTSNIETDSSREVKVNHKKKKFFPRIFMFFARKKVQSSKSK
ncbi:Protein WEAK CHLOROPLAST MOVEMENT UNDER BLUE LIGHT 1 [Abeliophyllum distichum]|uniref:Protein WEAK CHLOROPLAST MOVEMENT UNDER BLUE LIGHT 1 n=1 Tax=Abeliophyllum distichum TaxID=126358 RepID=A0ABD1SU50_9LAMI